MREVVVIDDGLGTNVLSLAGSDAAFFELVRNTLFLKAGTILDFETKPSYQITLQVDDASLGTNPDANQSFTLAVTDQDPETPPPPALLITEVAPWSSGDSAVGADWFEVTNISPAAIDITGWKVDDSSKAFGSALALNGVTSIAPGESVIFIETSDLLGKAALFRSHWFGANPPAGLQIGGYSGSGIGLSTSGDAVWLFDPVGQIRAGVTFGAAATGPFATFDNTAGLNNTAIAKLSQVGINGALQADAADDEIGAPGYAAPGLLRITEVAPWSSGNSPVGADWFEVTNVGARVVSLEGWKIDDSSESPLGGAVPLGLDASHAHVQPGGVYHYHGLPTLLMDQLGLAADQHSPLIGWAADGFPIYALRGYKDPQDPASGMKTLRSSYDLKPGERPRPPKGPGGPHDGAFVQDYVFIAGHGDLDECNGRFCVTPDFPRGVYAYFLTAEWPVIPRAFRGTPVVLRGAGGPGGPGRGKGSRPR